MPKAGRMVEWMKITDRCSRGSGENCQAQSSAGLSLVLDNKRGNEAVVTAIGCIVKESCRSDLDRTLRHIFDVMPTSQTVFTSNNLVEPERVCSYLQSRLHNMAELEHDLLSGDREGMCVSDIGFCDGMVTMDERSAAGDIRFMKRGLLVESQAIFSSAWANACVSKGKWMYEVTLETAGIQQLGWATRSCKFTSGEGVGDSHDSYAYDGKRVRKWSVAYHPYGQPWAAGDVIGCCVDLDSGLISFYRNGMALGVAFEGVGTAEPKLPYYPAISLSQGERSELNFGGRPFKYPVKGFQAIQAPPVIRVTEFVACALTRAQYLLGCLQRLVQMYSQEFMAAMAPVDRLRYFRPLAEDSVFVGKEICKSLTTLLTVSSKRADNAMVEYIIWGALVPFLIETYRPRPPHDGPSVDKALDILLATLDPGSAQNCIVQMMEAFAFGCRTSPVVLVDCPYTCSYPYLALTCHILHRQDVMVLWWSSDVFESCLEGFFARKGPNKRDLKALMPTVWWPGSREDLCSENNMRQTTSALSRAIGKVEELQWELCHLIEYAPTSLSGTAVEGNPRILQSPGSIFKAFLRHLVSKNKGATRNMPPPGLSDNSVLVTAYTVLLRFLSEGLGSNDLQDESSSEKDHGDSVGFLHRGCKRRFKVRIFLESDPHVNEFARLGGTYSHLCKINTLYPGDFEDVEWEEGCMEDTHNKVTHSGKLKPCCCSGVNAGSATSCKGSVRVLNKCFSIQVNAASESSSSQSNEYDRENLKNQAEEELSSSGRADPGICGWPFPPMKKVGLKSRPFLNTVSEDEWLDTMVLLYHLGVATNFKQASYCLQQQLQYIAQLDDTDRQIRAEKTSSDLLKRLKEARTVHKEDLTDCVRQNTWYRISLFSRWKQRGMYGTCMWIVQLLMVLSERDVIFSYVPEYYIETLLDCFHALRRSDPPFVSPKALLQQGLSSLVTFLVAHFNDTRIANADIRDILLQSISVLVQYKEHVVAFECNTAAIEVMPGALLSSFDNRFWIPVTNILLRLCKGSGFGASKASSHGESCSPLFQRLLREHCMRDEKLFSSFLNRLFNTLNWTITEFSVSIKEMQDQTDQRQVPELLQRKCAVMFELSCNLERILEYFTRELPQAFLCGPEVNLVRLCELLIFVLNHTTSSADALLFDSTVRQQGQSPEKINRAMILAPLVGIVLNLAAAKASANYQMWHDVMQAIMNVDVSSVVTASFEYLDEFDWVGAFKGDPSLARLPELKDFVNKLKIEVLAAKQKESEEDLIAARTDTDYVVREGGNSAHGEMEEVCSICYVCEVNTMFSPCKHKSCWRCISRHLLNNQRCFFCNATVQDLRSMSAIPANGHGQFHGSGAPNGLVAESGHIVKIASP